MDHAVVHPGRGLLAAAARGVDAMKRIIDLFADPDKHGEIVWSVRGRDELRYIEEHFHTRDEALSFMEGLRLGFQIGRDAK